jgi:hypothetical protein
VPDPKNSPACSVSSLDAEPGCPQIYGHLRRISSRPFLPVHASNHVETVGVWNFICGHQPGPKDISGIKVFALGRSELTLHLTHLGIASTEVIEDTIAKDMLVGVFATNILASSTKKDAESSS